MKKRSVVFLISFLLYTAWACGSLLDKISVKPFPLLGQLPSNKVYCMYQDQEGVLWLGTTDGLCRYDATGFMSFALLQCILHFCLITTSGKLPRHGMGKFSSVRRKECVRGIRGPIGSFLLRIFVDEL